MSINEKRSVPADGKTGYRTPTALPFIVYALISILVVGGLAACSQSSSSTGAPSISSGAQSDQNVPSSSAQLAQSAASASSDSQQSPSAGQYQGKIEVRDEFVGEWKSAVLAYEDEVPPEAPDGDYTLTISKDGVVRVSTGEVYLLRYRKGDNDLPDPSGDYYFVGEGLPSGHENILYDIWGDDAAELWECHYLENGQKWEVIFTHDGSVPKSFQEEGAE